MLFFHSRYDRIVDANSTDGKKQKKVMWAYRQLERKEGWEMFEMFYYEKKQSYETD